MQYMQYGRYQKTRRQVVEALDNPHGMGSDKTFGMLSVPIFTESAVNVSPLVSLMLDRAMAQG